MSLKNKTIVIASGYFNPAHTGHLDYLENAKDLGDLLFVIVNNDRQVELKGSQCFTGEDQRTRIIQALECVDQALVSVDFDRSVKSTVAVLYNVYRFTGANFIFANGGDQKSGVPEEEFCMRAGIQMVYGVGGEKTESSSNLLQKVKQDS
tara:strand:+ start:6422 stop:6871 length:450 start_codon:yes stop_codon:yes gene_type:complete